MSGTLKSKCIGFVGVGVMGQAIIKSLLAKSATADQICITDKVLEKAEEVSSNLKVSLKSISEIGQKCEVILLAVKPQDLAKVLSELKTNIKADCLVISIAAGKTIKFIEENLGSKNPVIRVMPNTPALIGKGVSAIAAGTYANEEHLEISNEIFASTGLVIQIPEDKLNAVTALSGSGPAYFFNFIEAMVNAGVELGLTREIATTLAIETISGSAAMLKESGLDAATLRTNVTSPNGTTAAALQVFSENSFENIILQAMSAAEKRAQELA